MNEPNRVNEMMSQRTTSSEMSGHHSTAGFYPKVIELQKRIGAKGFVIAATSRGLNSVEPLKIIMSNSSFLRDEAANNVLKNAGTMLASHVRKSSLPIYWAAIPENQDNIELPKPARRVVIENAEVSGLAFPVHLGGKQSGLAIFFTPTITTTREMQIDIHRRSYLIMRELLRISSAVKTDAVSINNREAECLQFAGNGMTSDDIAVRLGLSVHTINAHLSSATTKLDSVNRIQAIAKAIRLGLIS